MQKLKLLMCIAFLFSGSAFAQFGDCNSFGISDVHFQVSDYEDTDSDGCRDGNYATAWFRVSSILRGSPITPQGNYYRFLVEIYGSNSGNLSNPVLVHSETLNPETDGAIISTQLQDFRYNVSWNYSQEPVSYKRMFIRLRVQDFRWVSYAFGGEYVGFSSDYCDSGSKFWCPGTDIDTGGGGTPDLKQDGYAGLTTSEGTTLIPGYGSIPKLRSNSNFTYNVQCKNGGVASASNFQIETFVTASSTFTTAGIVNSNAVGSVQSIASLGAGQSVQHLQTDYVSSHPSKFTTSGFRYFHTYFDTGRVVDESSESNNLHSQVGYFFAVGDAGREGTITLTQPFSATTLSFLYQDVDAQSNQVVNMIGSGMDLKIFPALGAGQLALPVFQATITNQHSQLDISSISSGLYRVVIDGHYIQKLVVN